MINRMPQPAWVPFVADKAPHFVDLRFPSLLKVHQDFGWVYGAQQRVVDRFQCSFFFPERTQHGVGTDAQHPCGIVRTPLALRLISMICCFTSGKRP